MALAPGCARSRLAAAVGATRTIMEPAPELLEPEPPPPPPPPSWKEDPALLQLASWCASRGAKAITIEPAHIANSGRGFVAKRDVAAGELLLSIPGALLLNSQTARRHKVCCTAAFCVPAAPCSPPPALSADPPSSSRSRR